MPSRNFGGSTILVTSFRHVRDALDANLDNFPLTTHSLGNIDTINDNENTNTNLTDFESIILEIHAVLRALLC